jgi:ribosomal protein L17
MVKQKEMAVFVKIKATIEDMAAKAEAMRERLITAHRSGEAVEKGRLVLKVTINDEAEKTAWKPVVEAIAEKHPELRGGIASIVRANTKPQPYEQVRVVPVE